MSLEVLSVSYCNRVLAINFPQFFKKFTLFRYVRCILVAQTTSEMYEKSFQINPNLFKLTLSLTVTLPLPNGFVPLLHVPCSLWKNKTKQFLLFALFFWLMYFTWEHKHRCSDASNHVVVEKIVIFPLNWIEDSML